MDYVYLILATVLISTTSIFASFYNRRTEGMKNASLTYNFINIASVLFTWLIIYVIDFSFELSVLPYAIAFGICFSITTICLVFALKNGPVALTSLILQFSLIGVTAYGLLFWNQEITPLIIIGIVMTAISLYLCLYSGKDTKTNVKITKKWLILVALVFLGNATCTILQKSEQIAFNGKHGNMFMFFGTVISLITTTILFSRGDKTQFKQIVKSSGVFPVLAGIFNAGLNLCIILLATSSLSPSIIYPVIAVGGLMLTTLASAFIFKERLKWWQWLGIVLGAVAVAILSI